MRFLFPFLNLWIKPGDSPQEIRQKYVLVPLLFIPMVTILCTKMCERFLWPHDMEELKWIIQDALQALLVLILAWLLAYLYLWGLTLTFKVSVVVAGFVWVLVYGVVAGTKEDAHIWCVFILDFCVFSSVTGDEVIMNRLAHVVIAVGSVYALLHAQANVDEDIRNVLHPFEFEFQPFRHMTTGTIPMIVNFVLVKFFASNTRKEEERVKQSVDVARRIAQHLANFDLDSAEALLKQGGEKSPVHDPLSDLLRNLRSYRPFLPGSLFQRVEHTVSVRAAAPNKALEASMYNRATSWQHATAAVARLREPGYTLSQFDADVKLAFPELNLYSVSPLESEADHVSLCTSGMSGSEEMQRTLGALYSVYCFARLDIDGKDVFSFGVDENWEPIKRPQGHDASKQVFFRESMEWDEITDLFLRAGIMIKDDTGALQVHIDRMMAMLVLTAVHDVMKNPALLPKVQKVHAPFQGIEAGNVIHDHDTALAYVMENFPGTLPSYHALEPGQRAPILFTQSKMAFNHGWLVQGEAPPGALFTTFKQAIVQGGACEADISFYFVHWLTDLAGAEVFGSRPWPGSEKFVLKFPRKVLSAFLDSFAFVDRLAVKTEVEVMEDYLRHRWTALGPPASAATLPSDCSIAAMRLALMAQGFEAKVVQALEQLAEPAQSIIAQEMSRTGLPQQFKLAPGSVVANPAGPAILVYYAPALVQRAGAEHALEALHVLAAVFSAARSLFPLTEDPSAARRTVVVRIDALKSLVPKDIMAAAGSWQLEQVSDMEAQAVRTRRTPVGAAPHTEGSGNTGCVAPLRLPSLEVLRPTITSSEVLCSLGAPLFRASQ